MPRKEPLYPHVPKSREPVYPRASISQEKSPSTLTEPIVHEATSVNPDPAELMPVEVNSAFPKGDESVFTAEEKAQIDKFINEVPDKNDTRAINYWLDWEWSFILFGRTSYKRYVYLEGWIDQCLAGTGFPPMEGGEWDEKIQYMIRVGHRTLIEKQEEKNRPIGLYQGHLTLIEGGFREFEAGDKEWLYGVTWGVYSTIFEKYNPIVSSKMRFTETRNLEGGLDRAVRFFDDQNKPLAEVSFGDVGEVGIVIQEIKALGKQLTKSDFIKIIGSVEELAVQNKKPVVWVQSRAKDNWIYQRLGYTFDEATGTYVKNVLGGKVPTMKAEDVMFKIAGESPVIPKTKTGLPVTPEVTFLEAMARWQKMSSTERQPIALKANMPSTLALKDWQALTVVEKDAITNAMPRVTVAIPKAEVGMHEVVDWQKLAEARAKEKGISIAQASREIAEERFSRR